MAYVFFVICNACSKCMISVINSVKSIQLASVFNIFSCAVAVCSPIQFFVKFEHEVQNFKRP